MPLSLCKFGLSCCLLCCLAVLLCLLCRRSHLACQRDERLNALRMKQKAREEYLDTEGNVGQVWMQAKIHNMTSLSNLCFCRLLTHVHRFINSLSIVSSNWMP